jgi:hypothetical protein
MTREDEMALHVRMNALTREMIQTAKQLGVVFIGIEVEYRAGFSQECLPLGERADSVRDESTA